MQPLLRSDHLHVLNSQQQRRTTPSQKRTAKVIRMETGGILEAGGGAEITQTVAQPSCHTAAAVHRLLKRLRSTRKRMMLWQQSNA